MSILSGVLSTARRALPAQRLRLGVNDAGAEKGLQNGLSRLQDEKLWHRSETRLLLTTPRILDFAAYMRIPRTVAWLLRKIFSRSMEWSSAHTALADHARSTASVDLNK